jgi:hypothetical protein
MIGMVYGAVFCKYSLILCNFILGYVDRILFFVDNQMSLLLCVYVVRISFLICSLHTVKILMTNFKRSIRGVLFLSSERRVT